VGLADLRDELGESTNRHEVDAALFRLAVKDRGTNIVPESNQKMLRPVDREAAISIGNQPRHAIAIDDPSPRPTGGLDLAPVISAVESGDRDKARAEMAKLLKANGITPYGKAGDSTTFNRAEHQALPGSTLAPGAKVRIVRPGHTLSRDGEDIPLGKSLVEPAGEADAPAPVADPLADLSSLDAESARDALDLETVRKLKELLAAAGLKKTGRKRELVDRLVEHLNGAPKAVRSRALAMADVPTDDILDAELRALDGNQLKHYWTKGKGLARWRAHPHPWTKLRNLLLKHVGPGRAERMASDWFHEVFGYWPGHRKGSNPVGPG
jgi:hypothetical protein